MDDETSRVRSPYLKNKEKPRLLTKLEVNLIDKVGRNKAYSIDVKPTAMNSNTERKETFSGNVLDFASWGEDTDIEFTTSIVQLIRSKGLQRVHISTQPGPVGYARDRTISDDVGDVLRDVAKDIAKSAIKQFLPF
jgi:hypothetical protein